MKVLLAAVAVAVAATALAAAPAAANDQEIVLSFSGGGNRAALGSMTALAWLEDQNNLEGVTSVNGLSGGSWGSTLFAATKFGKAHLEDIKSAFTFPTSSWGDFTAFSRATSAKGKFSLRGKSIDGAVAENYRQWKSDVRQHIFAPTDIDVSWAKLGSTIQDKYKWPLCSFFNDGSKKKPDRVCKWCTGSTKAECIKYARAKTRTQVDLTQPVTLARKASNPVSLPNGVTALDMMTLTSSAWTFIAGEVRATVGTGKAAEELKISDAGIYCNLPFDPNWVGDALPSGKKRRTVMLFDFSDNVSIWGKAKPLDALKACVKNWNSKWNLGATISDVQRKKKGVKSNALEKGVLEDTHLKKVTFAHQAEGVTVYWVQFRNLKSDAELMKTHRTTTTLGWPLAYGIKKINDIQTEFRQFLRDHVQDILRKELNTGFSTVGIAKLFDEGDEAEGQQQKPQEQQKSQEQEQQQKQKQQTASEAPKKKQGKLAKTTKKK